MAIYSELIQIIILSIEQVFHTEHILKKQIYFKWVEVM